MVTLQGEEKRWTIPKLSHVLLSPSVYLIFSKNASFLVPKRDSCPLPIV